MKPLVDLDEIKDLPPSTEEEENAQRSPADALSTNEAKQFASGKSESELRAIAAEKEASRNENFKDHFEKLAIISLYIVWLLLLAMFIAWVYHLLTPSGWPRLPEDQVRQIQGLLTGSILGIAGSYLRRRVG